LNDAVACLTVGGCFYTVAAVLMKKSLLFLVLATIAGCLLWPTASPAALIWRKAEGWSWERAGTTTGNTPKEQLDVAHNLFQKKEYGDAVAAYRRLIRRWPASFAAEDARLGLAQSLAAAGYQFKAFKEYQNLIEKHPNSPHFDTALQRQFEIGNLFMAGYRDKNFGVRLFPAREKAIDIFQQVVKNGPYSRLGPEAQFRIGLAYEQQKEYVSAVRAYEKLMERYPSHPMAETAQLQIGMAYQKEAKRAEYDQNAANQAASAYTDFLVRFPGSQQVAHADQQRTALRLEQARGAFRIGQFYEKNKQYKAAIIYYNDVIEQNPKTDWAVAARGKISALTPRIQPATP